MEEKQIKEILELIEKFGSGIFPYEDTDNLYYPEHAIKSALRGWGLKNETKRKKINKI